MAELIAVPALMARLGIGRTKLYELIDSGELRSVKIGSRRFVTDAALDPSKETSHARGQGRFLPPDLRREMLARHGARSFLVSIR